MQSSTQLAIKYRPMSLADLVGQDASKRIILNAFRSKKLYRTYLFTGKWGCGKTSTARILAAMENCENGETETPCGKCKLCREIFSGKSGDILELNAAQNRGIDDVRNVKEFVSTLPIHARTKYVIWDECHALTKEASESMLKLLEEPPAHARFILCTTESHKVKDTIQSRTMPVRFPEVSWSEIRTHLQRVAEMEGIAVDGETITLCARAASGSVRNGLRNLEKIATFAGDEIVDSEIAEQALGVVSTSSLFKLIDSIIDRQYQEGVSICSNLIASGHDLKQVIEDLTSHLMILQKILLDTESVTLPKEEKSKYNEQIRRLNSRVQNPNRSIRVLAELFALLHGVARGGEVNLNPQALLEHYLLKSLIVVRSIEKESAK